jgi:subtilase family serine protease
VLGYIPEIPWNQNCSQLGLNGCGASAPNGSVNIVAGGGGPSTVYTKPKWQLGVAGMPNDNHRDQPDVSLFASPGFDGSGYIYCQSDQTLSGVVSCDITNATNGELNFGIIGGTSASAPAFAGIMALVNQYQSAHSGSTRQGNTNYVLYGLAKMAGRVARRLLAKLPDACSTTLARETVR